MPLKADCFTVNVVVSPVQIENLLFIYLFISVHYVIYRFIHQHDSARLPCLSITSAFRFLDDFHADYRLVSTRSRRSMASSCRPSFSTLFINAGAIVNVKL